MNMNNGDMKVIKAMWTIKNYCNIKDSSCADCIMSNKDECTFECTLLKKHPYMWNVPKIPITDEEKAILRNLDLEYKWIARDENGDIYIYKSKPYKNEYKGAWETLVGAHCFCLFPNLFKWCKWEEEPWHIPDLLKD